MTDIGSATLKNGLVNMELIFLIRFTVIFLNSKRGWHDINSLCPHTSKQKVGLVTKYLGNVSTKWTTKSEWVDKCKKPGWRDCFKQSKKKCVRLELESGGVENVSPHSSFSWYKTELSHGMSFFKAEQR